ncbi:MAG: aromatic amino acid lyase [Phycisphaerales bacterium]
MTDQSPVTIFPDAPLSPVQIESVARSGTGVRLSDDARESIIACRARLESVLGDGLPHYGINTGFGSLSRKQIDPSELEQLQLNLIRSHAAGVGDPLPEDVVRAMMLVLVASLSRGHSGVRIEIVEQILALLNSGITPIVPESGSVGASGDLAPLSHCVLAMIGEGEVFHNGQRRPAAEALHEAGIDPVALVAKEGLALINGTHLMTGRFALIARISSVVNAALIANAMSIGGPRIACAYLDPRVYLVRKLVQHGARRGSSPTPSVSSRAAQSLNRTRPDSPRVQDPYSFRCAARPRRRPSTRSIPASHASAMNWEPSPTTH